MNISTSQNQPSFSAKFIDNKAFRDVVKYAENTKQLQVLDTALNKINNVKAGDILIIHGKNAEEVYSNFNMGRRAIQNLGAKTPEEASFNAIIQLGELGRKFRRLVGGELKLNLTANDLVSKYGVK